jgi:hypothetical protein
LKIPRLVSLLSGVCLLLTSVSFGTSLSFAGSGIQRVGVRKTPKDPRSSRTYKGVRNLWGPPVYRVPRTPIGIFPSYRVIGQPYRSAGRVLPSFRRPTYRTKLPRTESKTHKRSTSVPAPRKPVKVSVKATRVAKTQVARRIPRLGLRTASSPTGSASVQALRDAFRSRYGFAD